LVGTVANPVSGNVLTNDVFGADGRGNGGVGLVSITVDGVTYTYDKATDQITSDGQKVGDHAELTVTTEAHGTLEFDFASGDFTYVPANGNADVTENFSYTIIDGDGDVSTSTLTINVADTDGGSSLRTMSLAADSGAGAASTNAMVADDSTTGETGDRLHGGGAGRAHGSTLSARDIFAGHHELDLSTLGHRDPTSHAALGPEHQAVAGRPSLDVAPPPAAAVGAADIDFHHAAG
jgi:hypothetical protein